MVVFSRSEQWGKTTVKISGWSRSIIVYKGWEESLLLAMYQTMFMQFEPFNFHGCPAWVNHLRSILQYSSLNHLYETSLWGHLYDVEDSCETWWVNYHAIIPVEPGSEQLRETFEPELRVFIQHLVLVGYSFHEYIAGNVADELCRFWNLQKTNQSSDLTGFQSHISSQPRTWFQTFWTHFERSRTNRKQKKLSSSLVPRFNFSSNPDYLNLM